MRVAMTLEQCWHRTPGGTASAAIELAWALRRRDDIELIGVAARHLRPPAPHFTPPVPVRQLPLERHLLYEAWHLLRRPPVQRATGPVDVVHATGIAVPPRSAPLVVTVHDLAFLHDRSRFTRNGMRFFMAALDRALTDADAVSCSSNATLEDCVKAGFDRSRLHLVPLGVRVRKAGQDAVERARRTHGLGGPYVIWVGSAEPRKNLAGLVEAFRRLDRTDLTLVLVGPGGWLVDVDELIAGIADQVVVTGFVPQAERDALMAGAEAFCLPSFEEGFGLSVLEAMAQGTPVITSAGTATEEVAGGSALLVQPSDVDSIADAMRQVLDDAELASRLADAGPRRAAECSWDRTAALTMDVYHRVGC